MDEVINGQAKNPLGTIVNIGLNSSRAVIGITALTYVMMQVYEMLAEHFKRRRFEEGREKGEENILIRLTDQERERIRKELEEERSKQKA